MVQVDIGLTEEGQKRWSDVVKLVHACARQVRELPPDEVQRIWKEGRDMSAIYLRFQQVSECIVVCGRGGRGGLRVRRGGGCSSGNGTELGDIIHAAIETLNALLSTRDAGWVLRL